MVFKSDKQRKKVMAMLRGGTKSAVNPQIVKNKFKKLSIENQARVQVGDGKTPNKYFVTISNDFEIFIKKQGMIESASEVMKFKAKGKAIKVFNNFNDAKDFAESINLGVKSNNFSINSVFIEDRLSGQVFVRNFTDSREDIKFTQEQEKKKGVESTT